MVSEKFELTNLTQNFRSRVSYLSVLWSKGIIHRKFRPLKRAVIFSLFLNIKKLFWTRISIKGVLDFDILRPQYDSTVARREDIIIIIIIIIFEINLYCIYV